MRFWFIFCYFSAVLFNITFSSSSFFNDKCDEFEKRFLNSSPQSNDTIINAQIGDFPHVGVLAYTDHETGNYIFRCGASLISKKFIILPAHCAVFPEHSQPKFVRFGVVDLPAVVQSRNSQTDYFIKKITVHPEFHRRAHSNNIALAELEKKVTFTSRVRPACLYSNNQYTTDGKIINTSKLISTEWNEQLTDPNNTRHLILHRPSVSYVHTTDCSMLYMIKYNVTMSDGQICASTAKKDTCENEIGGPLQIHNGKVFMLVGIPSHGSVCGNSVPTVYSYIYHYLDWIKSVAWD